MAPIRDEDVKGMVFDCDGTLVDTMPAYSDLGLNCVRYMDSL